MDATRLIRRLHHHLNWVDVKLLAAAESLSEEQLCRTFPIGQGSIWKSLLHLYAAENVWLEALLGDESPVTPGDLPGKLPGNQQGEGAVTNLADLKARWTALDRRWADYLASLTADRLDEIVYKTSTSSGAGKRHGTSRADVLLHVCTHAQYTTAQVVNMLKQVGAISLPDVMLISLARAEAAASTPP